MVIVTGDIGRNWQKTLQLNWKQIFTVQRVLTHAECNPGIQEVIQCHQARFSEGQDCIQGFKVISRTKPGSSPIFCKACAVPYALKEAVEKELNKSEEAKVISNTEKSDWAAPIVTVPKVGKTIRICSDYAVSINQCIEEETYPLPNTEDLFATLAGGTSFSKPDLSHVYQQLQLDEESEKYLTINTQVPLSQPWSFKYPCNLSVPYGAEGADHVTCLDDILITASSEEQHEKRLGEVLTGLEKHGIRVKLPAKQYGVFGTSH